MTINSPLSDDILYAISCIQDYRDTIDVVDNEQLWNDASKRIERLFRFYYQLVGFNPYEKVY